ncbi:MAG: adenylosuccinate synthase [Fervidobacterium sp.]|nr:adenylosuccinate synthase [Fervidobacterium sp.]
MNVVCYGLQWGDEGKGKVTTYLSKDFDYVVRYSGGSNAGHTVEYESFKLVHHLIPSFDVRKNAKGYIANGVIVDFEVLIQEINELKKIGVNVCERIKISALAHVALPVHKMLDEKIESVKADRAVGTTKRGIGPAYADKVHRIGLRIIDFSNYSNAIEKLEFVTHIYKNLYGIEWNDYEKLFELYENVSEFIVYPVEIKNTLENLNVLFEGTQGVLLDVDMGSYPYVTGSYCSTTGIESGVGFPVKIDKKIGVFKAYLTRVGEGPFPTEIFGQEAENLRKAGKEYGATTGRPRRCGWLDLPLLKYAIEVSGCTEMIMTKADILSGMEKISVGVSYKINGKHLEIPKDVSSLKDVEVQYLKFEGWKNLEDPNFERFKDFIEAETGVKISYVSTGAKVDEIIKT